MLFALLFSGPVHNTSDVFIDHRSFLRCRRNGCAFIRPLRMQIALLLFRGLLDQFRYLNPGSDFRLFGQRVIVSAVAFDKLLRETSMLLDALIKALFALLAFSCVTLK